MDTFRLDTGALAAMLRHARRRTQDSDAESVAHRAGDGGGLEPEDMAFLWFASRLSTESLYRLAVTAREKRAAPLETFSPLYMTNTCDAECRMCGMRRDNDALVRETAPFPVVAEQLRILARRGMCAVALLTGEYRAATRSWALAYVNRALRETQSLGFAHVLLNVGSIDAHEFSTLLAGIERSADESVRPKLTMCTFQETYSRPHYGKFMGTDPDNPRSDYDRRLENFDRARRAGMRVANPGILVGLNPDLAFELTALALHARHLIAHDMEVYLSVPRLRQIAGRHQHRGAGDEQFIRLVSLLSLGLPQCKIVITTREPPAIQHKLVPIVSVLSAGSAAVAPYTQHGARFPLEMSQFEVVDQRPFEEILGEYTDSGAIENYRN
jgi:2-iminoacetate synthase